MKKFLVKSTLAGVLLASATYADAQISIGNILKNITSGAGTTSTTNSTSSESQSNAGSSILSSLTNIFSSSLVATKDKIIGTWVYEEPAVVMSSDNTLKNLGGKLASATIENKLKEQFEKYGIKKGSVKMVFDKSGNFTQTLMGKTFKGTYTIEDKNIILKYGGKISQIAGTTQLDGNNLLIVMDASKLLKYVNALGSLSGNSLLGTASSLVGSMDGLECGLKLVKQ